MRTLAVLTLTFLSLSGQPAAYRGDWTADSRITWRDDDGEPRVQFNLRSNAGDNRWGFGVKLRDLAGLPSSALSNTADNIQFAWTREAGVFRFSGSFDQGRGNGTYTFTPDASFISNIGAAGYRALSTDDVVRLAVVDVTVAHVRGLSQAGYTTLPLDDVIRTRIHRVTPEFIRDLAAVGYKGIVVDDLVRMGIHGATPANIKALQAAGIRGSSVEDLIKFRIHKVTPDYIKGLRDVGFVTVSEEQLVRMKIHKVDAQFIRDARADGLGCRRPATRSTSPSTALAGASAASDRGRVAQRHRGRALHFGARKNAPSAHRLYTSTLGTPNPSVQYPPAVRFSTGRLSSSASESRATAMPLRIASDGRPR
ncbi:MAG: hypothetical protein Q7R30_00690 [Acidobacteriota bacterium]|nr:hypothetical protein [Acidobacteriota bacterium]